MHVTVSCHASPTATKTTTQSTYLTNHLLCRSATVAICRGGQTRGQANRHTNTMA